jgi:hypothetical protein
LQSTFEKLSDGQTIQLTIKCVQRHHRFAPTVYGRGAFVPDAHPSRAELLFNEAATTISEILPKKGATEDYPLIAGALHRQSATATPEFQSASTTE